MHLPKYSERNNLGNELFVKIELVTLLVKVIENILITA